ncbi:tannase/feruloyl esterase family alpha/beta hydrolase [Salinarimonas rosea]|uniref:tannase/feruloyl esterase family alpha/beta hydrolase n=1 Tax=Salinarimonas rosea TaxID=552063 RepID=UPI0004162577|nr:tannase/feruloyl esterase family alpha/beta hydrolase [Salinarimonas rosea]
MTGLWNRTMPRALAAAASLAIASTSAAAQEADAAAAERCAALRDVVLDAAFVTTARVIAQGETLPAYCEVRVTARPAVSIEVRLPLADWNGKLYQTGCGGFCGILGRADAGGGFINAMGPGLARGYATATSDSGHHGLSILDASWAASNPPAERDWGWRSVGETNRVANALVEAFYEEPTERDYFQGCSTGGRMANRAALTYPDMFDGIISGAPALDYTGLVATKFSWLVQANTAADGSRILTPAKVPLVAQTVMAQCDATDGAEDGVIADPRACSVDYAAVACEAGAEGADCLTEADREVLAKWRQGPVNAAGEQLYPGGVPEGSEPFWALWLTGREGGGAGLLPGFVDNFGAWMAFPEDPGTSWTAADFDFEEDPARLATMAAVYNADDPDLSAFREAGGRMIVWHGWADPLVTPYKTVDWYEKAAAAAGGEETLEENVRLFMIPGMDHCGLQPGPDGISQASLDLITALERWVEQGEAPTTVLADE